MRRTRQDTVHVPRVLHDRAAFPSLCRCRSRLAAPVTGPSRWSMSTYPPRVQQVAAPLSSVSVLVSAPTPRWLLANMKREAKFTLSVGWFHKNPDFLELLSQRAHHNRPLCEDWGHWVSPSNNLRMRVWRESVCRWGARTVQLQGLLLPVPK